ncbi:MAG: efflux RND transporter permease subunit [candidate division Zixibacteria bacterium]|nr:efflux RND transporter permease subunit [candidate division Zixibacteria bacterium]
MKISDISVRRPVFATMMIAALLVLGWFSYTDLSVEMWPDVEFPFVVVQTVYPGASAETIETDVTREIEEAVNQISGIRHIISKAQEGFTYTFVEFELEVPAAEAAQEVRDKVSQIRGQLPDDIEEPIISKFDMDAQGVMSITVSGRRTQREITQLVKDRIKPRLEAVTGVGSVDVLGGKEREIQAVLNPFRMESYQVSINDVKMALMTSNLEIPGGRVDEASREYIVRVKGKLTSVDQFSNLVVKNHNGTPVYLSDVAQVRDTIVEQRSLARLNGEAAVAMNIIVQSGANVVDLSDGVKKQLAGLQDELPPDVILNIVNDNSTYINDSIHEILFNIMFGTILAVLVIFLFLLDLRPTLITGLSIPISIIATFTIMKFLGFTINFMTLLALSLAVGILIDDSIVVVENIYRRIQEGESPFKAALAGTEEIGLAVMATTFAIMVVFLPVAFMEGIIGRFFYQFGMTVAFAVLISLFVAFSLVPMIASRTGAPTEDPEKLNPANATGWWRVWLKIRRPLNVWNIAFDSLKPIYEKLLKFSLRHRILVMLVATATFFAAIAIVGANLIGLEFQAKTDQGKVYITATTPPGTTLETTSARFAEMEAILRDLPEVKDLYVTIGGENTPVTEGLLMVLLVNAESRLLPAQALVDSIRTLISAVPGVKVAVAVEPSEGGSNKPVEFSIRGDDREELARIAHRVQKIVQETPGTIDVDNTLEEGKPELQIDVDRQLADDLGVNVLSVSQTIRSLVEGEVVTQYKEGDQDYDVRVRLDEQYRNSEEAVGRILVESGKEVIGIKTFLVPVDRVAKFGKSTAIGEYTRYDRQPEVRVNANPLFGSFAGSVTNEAQARIDSTIQLPPGYSVGPVGEQEFMEESFQNIFRALILSIVFIYLLLASQYESFFDPFSIMLSLPLSLIGAILALWISGSSINIMTLIGIVMLMGLVTKNAILLIDFVKQRRAEGVDRTTAILAAGPIRLRPILMTTFATVFGMLPLALGLGPGAELRAPMAQAVIGGMLSSTLLTLVVVPVVYSIVDDFVGCFRRKKRDDQPVGEKAVVHEQ